MKRPFSLTTIQWIFFLVNLSLCLATRTYARANTEQDSRGDSIAHVTYLTKDNEALSVDIPVSPDGSLSSNEFFQLEVREARIESEAHVTCFFYKLYALMYPFSTTRPLQPAEPIFTIRLYCYDSSADKADGNTFVVFVEKPWDEKQLLRVRLEDGQSEGRLFLTPPNIEVIGNIESIALIDAPEVVENGDVEAGSGINIDGPMPYCEAVVKSSDRFRKNEQDVLEFSFEQRREVYRARPLDEVICYRKGSNSMSN